MQGRKMLGVKTLAGAVALSAGFGLASAATDPGAPGKPVGTVLISATSVAAGAGYTWGDGVLNFHGKQYHFSVQGVSVADVGYAKVTGRGRVYDLKDVKDFSGTYGAATGNATLGNGIGGQYLKNANGVELRIDQVSKGARLTGAAEGVTLTLKE